MVFTWISVIVSLFACSLLSYFTLGWFGNFTLNIISSQLNLIAYHVYLNSKIYCTLIYPLEDVRALENLNLFEPLPDIYIILVCYFNFILNLQI